MYNIYDIVNTVITQNPSYRTIVFFVIFIVISVLTFLVFKPVLSLVVASLVCSIVMWPIYKKISKYLNYQKRLSSLATIAISIVVVLLPAIFFVKALVGQVLSLASTFKAEYVLINVPILLDKVNSWLSLFPYDLGIHLTTDQVIESATHDLAPLRDWIVGSFWVVSNFSLTFMVNLTIFLILVYFILPKLPDIKQFLISMSPLSRQATQQYLSRSFAMLNDVLKGILVVAFVQGILGGFMLAIAGVQIWAFLTFAMMILAILPIGSVNFIMIPAGIFMIFFGSPIIGLITIIWSITVVSTIDNYLRSAIVSKEANVHPALMMVAVLGGLKAFGFMGILYGPVVVVMFLTTLSVYKQEYFKFDPSSP